MNARASATQVPAPVERYVDARELADLMGVSTSTIKRFVAAGMPSETWGMSRTRRFLASEAIAWARSRDRSRTMARRESATATPSTYIDTEPKE